MTHKYKTITVFASASASVSSVHHEPMRRTGELLAEHHITMVFGVGDEGMMGSVFQGVRNKNGQVIGITTQKLLELQCRDKSVYHEGEIKVARNLSERKMEMFQLGEAILVGPGGWGTIDEFSEFAVLIQTGDVSRKPMIFLNFNEFWKPLQELILNMLQEGTLAKDKVDYIEFVDHPEEIFGAIEKVQNRIDANTRYDG